MKLKPPLTLKQQITLLRDRGMTIDCETTAEEFLQSNHYYRLNIYFHKLMNGKDHYSDNVNFLDIIDIYKNDRWLRNKLLFLLEPIEIKTRSQVSHYLAITYGTDSFYQEKVFKDHKKYCEVYRIFEKSINRNKFDPIVSHHNKHYEGKFPIWVVIEFLSFNSLSKLYQNMIERDKKVIARETFGVNEYYLGQWLHVLSVLRNICAHYGYLYQREYPIRPKINKSTGWNRKENLYLFAQLLIIKQLTAPKLWKDFIREISNYQQTSTNFVLEDYGFPDNWESYLYLGS